MQKLFRFITLITLPIFFIFFGFNLGVVTQETLPNYDN